MEVKRNWMVFPASKTSLDTKSHQSIPSFVISEAFWSQEIWKAGWNPSLDGAPWRLRTLLRCPHMNERLETFKLWKQNVPTFQKRPSFPSEILSLVMCREQEHTHHVVMCFCACYTGQETHVCMQEMDAVWGTSGTWHWPPLIHTFPPPRLFYRQLPRDSCSVDLCNPEETPSLYAAVEMTHLHMWWASFPSRDARVHMWTVAAHLLNKGGTMGAGRHPSVL